MIGSVILLTMASMYFFPLDNIRQRTLTVFGQPFCHPVEGVGDGGELFIFPEVEALLVIMVDDLHDTVRQLADRRIDGPGEADQEGKRQSGCR